MINYSIIVFSKSYKNNMKSILITLAIIFAGFQGLASLSSGNPTTKITPLYSEPYVVVYGRQSCGFTQQTLKDLKRSNIPFEFKTVDDQSVADQLHSRMRSSGIDTRRYNLPVVDVSNDLSVRPKFSSISDQFNY